MPKFLLTNEVISSSLWKLLETNPSYSEDLTTKAKVGKSAVCTYFKFNVGVTVTTASDFPDISLAKNGWRTRLLKGKFIAGTWTFKVRLENDTKYAFSVKVAVRLSKSANDDGSNATLIGVFESPNVLNLPASAGGSVSDTWSVSLPELTFNNEYLFAEYRIHIEVAGGSVLCQCSFACDEDPSIADESIETPSFIIPPAPYWLTGWQYRKGHCIEGSMAGDVTNYQIKIIAHYGSGIDNKEDVYLNGKCRTDFGDIRFTSSDGKTELSYWMENKEDGNYAIFWVKVDSILAYPNYSIIYIYYGNPNVTTTSNQFTTGIAQLKEHRWTTAYASDIFFSKTDPSKLRTNSTTESIGEGFVFWVVPKNWINGKYLRFHWISGTLYPLFPYYLYIYDGSYLRYSDSDFPDGAEVPLKGAGELIKIEVKGTFDRIDEVLVDISSAQYDFVTIAFKIRDAWTDYFGYLDLDWVEVNIASGGMGNIAREDFDNQVVMELTGTYKDYGLYRNYISPEPIHGFWLIEEETAIIETIVANSFPMLYLAKPVKAQELISKVEGATITHVAKDFPEQLIKKDKAKELRSKWS